VATSRDISSPNDRSFVLGYLLPGGLLLLFWWLLYRNLLPFAKWVTYSVLSLDPVSRVGAAVEFFIYDGPKVILLLTLVVFGVGVLRSFFTAERARRILAGNRESAGTCSLRCSAS